ncbi:unnamed protein product, partial [Ectocarpus fasciculatus]
HAHAAGSRSTEGTPAVLCCGFITAVEQRGISSEHQYIHHCCFSRRGEIAVFRTHTGSVSREDPRIHSRSTASPRVIPGHLAGPEERSWGVAAHPGSSTRLSLLPKAHHRDIKNNHSENRYTNNVNLQAQPCLWTQALSRPRTSRGSSATPASSLKQRQTTPRGSAKPRAEMRVPC